MLTLGIDYGTGKNAVVLYDDDNPDSYLAQSASHGAEIQQPPNSGRAEQNPDIVLKSVLGLVDQIPASQRERIQAIGFTGQMHSVMGWNDGHLSNVVTWQDARATAADRLNEYRTATGLPLADGFGAVTLAEWAREGELPQWEHVASPVDWLAAVFTGARQAAMEPTFAASWGVWDIWRNQWNAKALATLGIPMEKLPHCVESGAVIGTTKNVPGLKDGIPVIASLGDNQASVLGSASNLDEELFLTLGTGAQLSFTLERSEAAQMTLPPGVEFRPFLQGRMLAVNPPLCGGKAWSWLGTTINSFLKALGCKELPQNELLDRLDAMACEAEADGLDVEPLFLGSRVNPALRGAISGISLDNFTLPGLARALATGIVRELLKPFPKTLIQKKKRIVGSGNCVRLCKSIQTEIKRQFGLPLELRSLKEEAALGAAKLAAMAIGH